MEKIKINLKLNHKQNLAWEILEDKIHTELFYGGGAGGGKSYLGCSWLALNCLRYEGSRWLMGRAILKSLKDSTLLTFFQVCREWGVYNDFSYNAIEGVIKWKNGSSIYLKDLFAYPSDPEFDSLGSTEYTGAFIDEASQISAKAKNIVMSRLRFKLDEFGIVPKLLIASNPSKNFLYFEFYKPWKENKLAKYRAFIPALVGDNPFISKYYIENLHKLDRISRERLLYGNFEYDDDPTKLFNYDSIIDLFTNEARRGEKYCIVDVAGFGRDKTIIGFWDGFFLIEVLIMNNISSQELDGLLNERKIPRSKCLVDQDGVGFGLVKDLSGIKGFVANARPITKKKETERDKVLHNYKNLKAQCWFELANYVNSGWIGVTKSISLQARELLIEDLEQIKQKDPGKDAPLTILSKEEIKENLGRSTDCFIAGTKVLTNKGKKNIESIKIGDKVITPYGARKVMRTIKKDTSKVYRLTFSDGNCLYATGNHRIYTKEGFKKVDRLMIEDRLDNDNLFGLLKWRLKHLLSIRGRNIGFRDYIDTITQTGNKKNHYIERYGKMKTGKVFQKDTTYTILTEMYLIILLKILNGLKGKNTRAHTCLTDSKIKSIQIKEGLNLKEPGNLQNNGIDLKMEESGIKNIIKKALEKQRSMIIFVKSVIKNLNLFAKKRLTLAHKPVLISIEILKLKKKENVYNITLEKDNVYYANGILVSNCGDMLMMRMYFELKPTIIYDFLSPRNVPSDKEKEDEKKEKEEESIEFKKQLADGRISFGPTTKGRKKELE